ncbi:hypothetical protein FES05_14880 [Salmonella enterica]|nr:hypothetical protein [Salmonella enterica]
MVMQRRYFKLNEADSVKYHKEYQEKIGKLRRKAIQDFLNTCNAAGYLSHQHVGVEFISALLVRGDVRIPVGENGEKPLPADMSPALIEIKHSEFIAITEE